MPRNLALGNGQLLINFDSGLNMRDFYYPHVGMLNHIAGHKNRIGVWVDETFSWVDEPQWNREIRYEKDTLIGQGLAVNPHMAVELRISNGVHFRENIYMSKITVTNTASVAREIRAFFNHDFSIDQTDIGDTALYDPTVDGMLHYKRDKCFIAAGRTQRRGMFQYATGTKRFGGAEGTWKDAEDGWLEGNPIAQGSVDSTISFRWILEPGESGLLDYWIVAGRSFEEVRRLFAFVEKKGLEKLLTETGSYWRSWVNKRTWDFGDLDHRVVALFKRSLLITRTQVDHDGAILAATDTDIMQYNRDHYNYLWPRDGALVAYGLDLAGYSEVTRKFYVFCRYALSPGGFLWHKYNPDGSVGSSWHPWVDSGEPQLPIQEDETALVLYSLWEFYLRTHDLEFIEELYDDLIRPAANFLVDYRDARTHLPLDSYDLWEERRGVFTFTSASVWAGLRGSAQIASLLGRKETAQRYFTAADEVKGAIEEHLYDDELGRFIRGFTVRSNGEHVKDVTLESSIFALFSLGVFGPEDPRIIRTMRAIEKGLWVNTPVGGVARYKGDYYFHKTGDFDRVPGNPWIICTLWLAQWYVAKAKSMRELRPAAELLHWVCGKTTKSGILSEQYHPETGEFLSVAPLTWSHATFVIATVKYMRRASEIREKEALATAWHESPS